MPQTRPIRRTVTNENEENGTARLTRAKAAALGVPSDSLAGLGSKKPLQAKKGATNAQLVNENAIGRKRTALGDVSNVNKGELVEVKEIKKVLGSTSGPVAKAAQPTGIQKSSRTSSSRPIVSVKERSNTTNELKRPASATSIATNVAKKRTSSSMSGRRSVKEESSTIENAEPLKDEAVQVKITQSVKVIKRMADGEEVETEVRRDEKVLKTKKFPTDEDLRLDQAIHEMDAEDEGDPLMVSEYVYEILEYMKQLEVATLPNPNYMDQQKELEWRMRGVLVDWLLEVHTRFSLLPETFYLTVNLIDRFLSNKVVQLERLQLVGVTAMFIASKYEEVLSPHIGNFRHVADDGFTDEEILSAERYILSTLNYDLSFPNPMHFMRRISKADNYDIQTRTLAKYLLEISLFDHRFLAFKPSINAAAAMYLARVILGKGTWDRIFEHYSGYPEEEIQPAFQTMIDYIRAPVAHSAFYKKYAGKRFLKASLHARKWAKEYSGDMSRVVGEAIGSSASNTIDIE